MIIRRTASSPLHVFKSRTLGAASASALAIAGVLSLPSAAQAQDLETVVVTGSHITTPGFTTPTPVTSVSQEQIQMQGTLQANQLEYQMPQLVPQINFQSIGGTAGQTLLNLRGLGATRTLILLDGRRLMPTSYDGTTDANIIPTSLIQRVDVVTGGASANYGSDAVSGVINFVLDNKYEGLKGSASTGESQYHDMKELDVTLTGGFSFAGGKGHMVVSGEAFSNSGANGNTSSTGGVAKRHWANQGYALIPGGAGFPAQISRPNVKFANMSDGSLITQGPLKGIYFGPGAVPQTMQYGTNLTNPVGTYMVGGTGSQDQTYGSIAPQLGRESLYTHVSYDLSDDITAWGQLLVIHNTAFSPITPNYDNNTLTGKIDNPYLPASIVSLMTANKITAFTYGRIGVELGLNTSVGHYYDVLWDAGLNGKVFGTWTWDLTAQFNSNSWDYKVTNERNNQLWGYAVDVTGNPAANGVAGVPTGAPVCRASLPTNPGGAVPGCVPINLFGINSITPAGVAYVGGTSDNYDPQQAWDIAANIQGVVLQDWAGDVSVAAGFESRRDSIHSYADAISIAKLWRAGNTLPFTGHTQVNEGYIEADVPLLKDLPFAQNMGLNIAGRVTDYSTSGTVETWKAGIDNQLNDEIRMRMTYSSDIRAPTLNDLFQTPGTAVNQLFNNNTGLTQTVTGATGGNPNLLPEQANTLTGGIVYAPAWAPGLQTSIDYYQIHLHNGIQATSAQQQVDNCQKYKISTACDLITFGSTGVITNIFVTSYNVGNTQQDGVDYELDYSMPGENIWSSLDGTFKLRAIGTYVDAVTSVSTTGVISNTVMTGSLPKWTVVANTSYTTDKYSLELDYRYTGALRFNNTYVQGVDIDNNHIASRYYFNLSGEYYLTDKVRLFGRVANLLNVSPPINPSNNLIEPMTLVSQAYDRIGRDYSVGVRFSF